MNIVPEKYEYKLRKALIKCKKNKVIKIIENKNIDINSYIDDESLETILFCAVNTLSEHRSSDSQLELVTYLLDNGAKPDIMSAENVNCLHLALEFHDLSEITLLLLTKGNANVNIGTSQGTLPLFIAIREYGTTWREEQKEINKLRFNIIKELLERGAKLTLSDDNIQSNEWVEWIHGSADEKLIELLKSHDILQ